MFTVNTAVWHSGGHLAVLFYIFFHHKKTWCSSLSCGALEICSNGSTSIGPGSSFRGLFPSNGKCLSTPTGCQAWKKEERDGWGNWLQFFTSSPLRVEQAAEEAIICKTKSHAEKRWWNVFLWLQQCDDSRDLLYISKSQRQPPVLGVQTARCLALTSSSQAGAAFWLASSLLFVMGEILFQHRTAWPM